jgi:putative multiple sugar transport system substrate-binding protein
MKKIVTIFLVATMFAAVLIGCTGTPEEPEPVEESQPEEEVQEPEVTEEETEPEPQEESSGLDIGIVLPTKEETRWLGDEAFFIEAIENSDYTAEILFSQNSSAIEKTNVETLITKGAKVIVLCPYDATAAAAAVEDAEQAGIPVISYDRLIMDTDALDYYVTFDSKAVGAAQAEFLVEKAGDTEGNNLYIYSGALTDNNSFLFFEGAWTVLQPKIADGTFVIQNSEKAVELSDKLELTRDEMADIMSTVDTEWSMDVSKSLAEAHLTGNDASAKGTVFVLGPADDDCARALSDAFHADAEVEEVWIVGADGVEGSVQYILDGLQSMTVYKDPNALVVSTMEIVDALLTGKEVETDTTYNNNMMDVPSIKADVVTVTRDNIVEVFFDGGVYDPSNFDIPEDLVD